MPSKITKKAPFKEMLIAEIESYMDKAFEVTDSEKRQVYREAIREMEHLLLTISEIE